MAVNRGLLREFALVVFLYLLNLGTDLGVFFEALDSYNTYTKFLTSPDYKSLNGTENYLFCSKGPWIKIDYQKEIKIFGRVIDACLFFLALALLLITAYIIAYVWIIIKTALNPQYLIEKREKYVRIKFVFGFACSMLQDIPMACIAVDLYAQRSGAQGLICWSCAQDPSCNQKDELEYRFMKVLGVLVVSLLAMLIVSLYKGITTFYRWTKIEDMSCWQIRSCVSLFAGTYYALIMLTPSLALFKYKFFQLESEKTNVFSDITDSLFMVGLIGWAVFAVIAFCCPLLRLIRM